MTQYCMHRIKVSARVFRFMSALEPGCCDTRVICNPTVLIVSRCWWFCTCTCPEVELKRADSGLEAPLTFPFHFSSAIKAETVRSPGSTPHLHVTFATLYQKHAGGVVSHCWPVGTRATRGGFEPNTEVPVSPIHTTRTFVRASPHELTSNRFRTRRCCPTRIAQCSSVEILCAICFQKCTRLNNLYGDKVLFSLCHFLYLSLFPFTKINIYGARVYNLLEHKDEL